jgi:hypothetical protein
MMKVIDTVKKNLLLAPGWRTRRRIVVIESDDWGAARIQDTRVFNELATRNPLLEKDLISRYDALETNEDLEALLEVFGSVKDCNGRPAVLTADSIMANPDYDRIAASGYQKYFYEPFTRTLERYPRSNRVMQLIEQGREAGIYHPQFHGREHVNIRQWLTALQQGNLDLLHAFRQGVFGIPFRGENKKRRNIVSALDFEDPSDIPVLHGILADGMQLFEQLFGFRSESFIATTYVWHQQMEAALLEGGVRYLQGIPYQYIPNPGGAWYKKKFHYTGQHNRLGQTYLVRNVFFEPSLVAKRQDWVGDCMKRIAMAFAWGKPAIICTHRVNFIGALVEKNRTENLAMFRELLHGMIQRWPDIEFMRSDQLGRVMEGLPPSAASS